MEQITTTLGIQAAMLLGLAADWAIGVSAITPSLRDISATIRRSARETVRKNKKLPLDRQLPVEHALPYGISSDLLNSWPQILAMSESPDALRVLAMYRRIPKGMANHLPIEAFCVAAKYTPQALLGDITAILVRQGAVASAIITAVNQARVVQKTIDMALTDEGFEDRKLFHTATGFLPTPKTGVKVINNMPAQAAPIQTVNFSVAPNPENILKDAVTGLHEARAAKAIDITSSAVPMPAIAAAAPQAAPVHSRHEFLDAEDEP